MSTELSKIYDPSIVEDGWYSRWLEQKIFSSQPSNKSPYSILMPPPNVTGILHLGHVLNHTIQDLYIRWHRMLGYETCWFPGIDHAGISTQTKVEQALRKDGITKHDLGRDAFEQKVWEWKEKYGSIILNQFQKIGNSADWDRTLFTLDSGASNAVQEVFIRLFDEGLVYRGKRIINWSPVAQSALSDEEVIPQSTTSTFYTLKYHLSDDSGTLLVGTVRPETLYGDVAVAVNPKDERFTHLIGKSVIVPMVGTVVPIIADDYVEIEFGTGALKITPAHDINDYEIGIRHNLPIKNTLNADGTLNELTGEWKGLDRFVARKEIVKRLESLGLIEKADPYEHTIGTSERTGEPIEPFLSDQWFVSMKQLAEPALKVVKDGDIKFYPQHWTKTYEHWLLNIKDWCISRQLWWGHRIPVYYTTNGEFTAARSEEEARKKLGLSATEPLSQDEDVLDTWFSSWLWPLTTMGWLAEGDNEGTKDLSYYLPTDLLVTAPEIIFLWVARMIMASLKFKGTIPFKAVYFTAIVRDHHGRKMSKSLGNSPDPLKIFEKYGADATRFTLMYQAPLGQDVRMVVDLESQDLPEIEFGRNFANKLWNTARFLLMKKSELEEGEVDSNYSLTLADQWILSSFHRTSQSVRTLLEQFRITDYSKLLYEFIWQDFCNWYVEIVKIQLYKADHNQTKHAILSNALQVFEGALQLLHPVMPFITEELWHSLDDKRGINVSISTTPPISPDANFIRKDIDEQFAFIQTIIEEIRTIRSSVGIAPQEKVPIFIVSTSDDILKLLSETEQIVIQLAKCSDYNISATIEKPSGSISVSVKGCTVYVLVGNTINIAEEIKRQEKEFQRLEQLTNGIEKKLSNERFVEKAPESVIENERTKLRDMRLSMQAIATTIASLQG
jgi:valyl-tRNA synthetase